MRILAAVVLIAAVISGWAMDASAAAAPKVVGTYRDYERTIALKSNGSAWHWAGTGGPATPTLVPRLTGLVDVGNRYAVKSDGTVWDLGQGPVAENPTQVAGLSNVIAIAEGENYILALQSDRTVVAVGSNEYGQLGNGGAAYGTFGPAPVLNLANVARIAATAYRSVAVLQDGTVWTWGENVSGYQAPGAPNDSCPAGTCFKSPRKITGLASITKVAIEGTYNLAVTSGGAIWRWGTSSFPSPAVMSSAPVNVVAVASGRGHFVALTGSGGVWTWGSNFSGQLGTGSFGGSTTTPMLVGSVPNAVGVFAFYDNTFAIRNDGQLFAWGDNTFGRLGDNSQADQATPVATVGINGAGFFNVLGNNTFSNPTGVTVVGPSALNAGESAAFTARATFASGLSKVVKPTWSASTGSAQVSSEGRLLLSASAASGSFNVNASHTENGGTVVGSKSVAATAAPAISRAPAISSGGGTHSVALRRDGTVVAWGENRLYQLGDGTGINRASPVQVNQLSKVTEVVARSIDNVALRSDGTVWIWGYEFGSTPQQTPITGAVRLGVGSRGSKTYFMKADNTLWDWNPFGGITAVGLTNVKKVSASSESFYPDGKASGHALALKFDGTVWSWGHNSHGELGDGTRTDRTTPLQVTGLPGTYIDVAAGGNAGSEHSLAVRNDGTVWAWGSRQYGALGDGTTAECAWPPTITCPAQLTPQQVPGLTNVKAVAIGTFFSLALKNDGTVWTWGGNWNGQLGDGTTVTRLTPVQLPRITNAVAIAAGGGHGLALRADGTVVAWGWKTYGQVGDGTFIAEEIAGGSGDPTFNPRRAPSAVLNAEGVGSLDTNDWYLDLDPTVANSLPASLVPKQLAIGSAAGLDASVVLDATIKYRSADAGKRVNNYVFGLVPPAFFDLVPTAPGAASAKALRAKAGETLVFAQLTPQGWVTVEGQLIAYSTSTVNAEGGSTNILNGVPIGSIPGARFCVGYGESGSGMLTSESLREVLTLKGAAAAADGLPCVVSGVYVDGPPASEQGSMVTFAASVVGISPTGSVQFLDGFANLGGSVALTMSNEAVARAFVSTSALAAGMHSIGASYSGNAQNGPASSEYPLLHSVVAPAAQTVVTLAGPASSAYGSEVKFTAVVAGNLPSGSVQFKDGGTNLGSPVPIVDGLATLRISTLGMGTHSISAAYAGDPNNTPGASGSVSHRVEEFMATAVGLTASPQFASIGTSVALIATVSGTNPSGTVTFREGGTTIATVPLSGGSASTTTSTLAAGIHSISAHYGGDANNVAASSESAVVRVELAIDPAQASADPDADGIPNGVEATERRNPLIKDNDVFSSARLFAMQQYRDFLGREGDSGGIGFWTNQINAGATRGQVVESFFNSAEFQQTGAPIVRLYFAYFLRIPDYGGLTFWTNQYRAGNPLAAISNAFAQSAEFVSMYGSLDNGQFVNLIYNNVLGRPPDAGGFAFWKGQLDTGAMTRGRVMLEFSESGEYRNVSFNMVYVTMMYVGMLRRTPEQGGFDFWVTYKSNGNPGIALINEFLASQEYRGRFLP